ncbi:MAG: diguanylate cyclase [Thermotogota bacterium]|nr:diguanylate cyclase [Thermotogota bacterium]
MHHEWSHLDALFKCSPEGIVLCDENYRVIRVNKKFCEMFGYPENELIDMNIDEVLARDKELIGEARYITEETRKGKQLTYITVRQKKDGTKISVSVLTSPVYFDKKFVGVLGIYRLISEMQESQELMREEFKKSRAILRALPDIIFVMDREGYFLDFEAKSYKDLNITPEKIIGSNIKDVGFSKDQIELIFSKINETFETGDIQQLVYDLEAPVGRRFYEVRFVLIDKERILSITRDITKRKETEKRLKKWADFNRILLNIVNDVLNSGLKENIYERLLEKSIDVISGAQAGSLLLKGKDNCFSYKATAGYDHEQLKKLHLTPEELVQGNGKNVKIVTDFSKDEELDEERKNKFLFAGKIKKIKCMLSIPITIDNDIVGFFTLDNFETEKAFDHDAVQMAKIFGQQVGNLIERIRLEKALHEQSEQLLFLSKHDPLTNLPNRRMLAEQARQYIALMKRNDSKLSLLYLDLDGFKAINDKHGHDLGDIVLKKFAQRFTNFLRESDVVARLGGDEFLFLLPDTDKDKAENVTERLKKLIEEPFDIEGKYYNISGSIGVSTFPVDGKTFSELLSCADRRMYGKKEKKLKSCFFYQK